MFERSHALALKLKRWYRHVVQCLVSSTRNLGCHFRHRWRSMRASNLLTGRSTNNDTKSVIMTTSINININTFNDDTAHPTSVTATTRNKLFEHFLVNWSYRRTDVNANLYHTGVPVPDLHSPGASTIFPRTRMARPRSISSSATVELLLISRKQQSERPFPFKMRRLGNPIPTSFEASSPLEFTGLHLKPSSLTNSSLRPSGH
jgi:hypothetical protein